MKISVNSTPLDVTFEKEKYLEEILPQIDNWLSESKMYLKELLIDGKHARIDLPEKWGKREIESVKELDIIAVSHLEKYVEDLQVIYQYISMLDKAAETGNITLCRDLLKDREIIAGSLDYFFSQGEEKLYSKQFLELTESEDSLKNTELKELLDKTSFLLQKKVQEVTTPVKTLTTTAAALRELIPGISDVSILLQTGKDKEAFNAVLAFIELSQTIVRVLAILKEDINSPDFSSITSGDENLNSFYTGFNKVLKELAEAFDSSDTVLIGDLLEYEIVPKIDTLLGFISLIENNQE